MPVSRLLMSTIAFCLVLASALAAGPKFTSTWKAPEASTTSFAGRKVAALLISDDQSLRISGEEALVRELASIGVTDGVASYRIVPREELRDADRARPWYERAGVDGVVSMRLVKAETHKTSSSAVWTSPTYSSLWGYYGYGWGSVYVFDPGRDTPETVAVIETLVFSVPQNKLLWAGVTESTDPKDAQRVIEDVVEATVEEMRKQGLLRKSGDARGPSEHLADGEVPTRARLAGARHGVADVDADGRQGSRDAEAEPHADLEIRQ